VRDLWRSSCDTWRARLCRVFRFTFAGNGRRSDGARSRFFDWVQARAVLTLGGGWSLGAAARSGRLAAERGAARGPSEPDGALWGPSALQRVLDALYAACGSARGYLAGLPQLEARCVGRLRSDFTSASTTRRHRGRSTLELFAGPSGVFQDRARRVVPVVSWHLRIAVFFPSRLATDPENFSYLGPA